MVERVWTFGEISQMPEGHYWVKDGPEYPARLMYVRKGKTERNETLFYASEEDSFGFYGEEHDWIGGEFRALGPVRIPEF